MSAHHDIAVLFLFGIACFIVAAYIAGYMIGWRAADRRHRKPRIPLRPIDLADAAHRPP